MDENLNFFFIEDNLTIYQKMQAFILKEKFMFIYKINCIKLIICNWKVKKT